MATCDGVRGVATALAILLTGALAVGAAVGRAGGGAAWAATGTAGGGASVSASRGCYLVGQTVHFNGNGFAASRIYDVTIDGVDFGQDTTDSAGSFTAHVVPGGLPAGVPQSVEELAVSDGSTQASTRFTLTRAAGARFLASRGSPGSLRAPFQVWGFSSSGAPLGVYVHYVSPSRRVQSTVSLGRTGGQCGYLQTKPMRVFPFSPSTGTWTLQVDSQRGYSSRPSGPAARIYVTIARG